MSLHTFQLCIETILAFVRSRYSAPVFVLKCVEMLESMYNRLLKLLRESVEEVASNNNNNNHTASTPLHPFFSMVAHTPSGAFNATMQRPEAHASLLFSPTMSSASAASGSSALPTVSSSPRLLLAHVWKSYCKPLLLAFRCVSACATDRVRVLYNTYHFLQRQRAQAEAAAAAATAAAAAASSGFGSLLLRASPQPPNSTSSSSTSSAAEQAPPIPLADFVTYMQEYAHVRQQALLLLKQILLSDEFASCVSECVTDCGASAQRSSSQQVSPSASSSSSSMMSHSGASSWDSSAAPCSSSAAAGVSPTASWCHACFWQLCLDELLFPLLRDLSVSASQSLFLESSGPFTLARVGAVNLLSKVFLRQLPALREHNPLAGFATTWLTVLKTLDRYMQIGVHLQRQQTQQMHAMHTARANSGRVQNGGAGGASPTGVPLSLLPVAGIEWSSESGLQLTESVAEALKNLVLVMKSQGVFDEPVVAAAAATTATAAAAATSATGSSTPTASALRATPTSELWELTVGMIGPWLPFIPALQAEITPPEPQATQAAPISPVAAASPTAAAAPLTPQQRGEATAL